MFPSAKSAPVMDLKDYLRQVPDFPRPGILFYDISTLLANPVAWRATIDRLAERLEVHKPDLLVGIESRGFLVTAPLAYRLGCSFAMMRKKGKLPGEVVSHHYDLEYGADTIQIQTDAIKPGQRVILLDDLLATGGTMAAGLTLARRMQADVRLAAFIIELSFLHGRDKLDCPVESLLQFDS